ncbi:MAG: hypothetical protein M3Z24_05800 [Chloroflexota bacterium]|nr:hypothetical protein [Chloroflexota bacterium]
MRQVQEENLPRRCPRCGGTMIKLPGGTFYWHADTRHPRCDITNLIDPPLAKLSPDNETLPIGKDEPEDGLARGKRRKK